MGYFGIILLQKLEKLWRFEVDQDFWRALYYSTVVFTACSWAKCQVWQMPTITLSFDTELMRCDWRAYTVSFHDVHNSVE